MSRTIMLIPTDSSVGVSNVSLGIAYSLEKKGISSRMFKPICQSYLSEENINDEDTDIIINKRSSVYYQYLYMKKVESLLICNKKDLFMEKIISRFYEEDDKKSEVIIVEGIVPIETYQYQFIYTLNYEISLMLNAEIVFISSFWSEKLDLLKKRIKLVVESSIFYIKKYKNITGLILNNLNIPIVDKKCFVYPYFTDFLGKSTNISIPKNYTDYALVLKESSIPILGCIPWNPDIIVVYAIDIARHLQASVLNTGESKKRKIKSIIFCTNGNLRNIINKFIPESLLVISPDRTDILMAACLTVLNGVEIGAILLTESNKIDPYLNVLFDSAFNTGIPVFSVLSNTWNTYLNLQKINIEISEENHLFVNKIKNYISNYIDKNWIDSFIVKSKIVISKRQNNFSPEKFRYHLTKVASQTIKKILLPEGYEPRIIKAASICIEKGIASCVLFGNQKKIQFLSKKQGIKLNKNIEIIDPNMIREKYIDRLVEIRKNKGMTSEIAKEKLKDNLVLATMMLEQGDVDGLVSGAIHTTADTIRPALELIKTSQGNSLVSSIFFMLFPEQVLIYGDCAINANPTSEQLSEIAIQSSNSATAFGIEARVAMLSYSTGNSGTGSDVEKVRRATYLARNKRPDLLIDGPLQYDAAIIPDVALLKAPNSPVAGKATVFIFPDLNSGNTTYKAVQRSANIISIGPMLQGMRKPVNDLSRGALVEDIVYSIAITVIQAKQTD